MKRRKKKQRFKKKNIKMKKTLMDSGTSCYLMIKDNF